MPDASWSFAAASLGGTSYLRLPRLLQWFTGNIGFHHVHHVNPRIPNYRLEECHNADAGFQLASTLTLRTALQASALHCGTAIWSDWCRFVSPPPIVDACGASTSIPGIMGRRSAGRRPVRINIMSAARSQPDRIGPLCPIPNQSSPHSVTASAAASQL